MKLALIPIDNRPVCYDLIKQIAAIDNDLQVYLPDKKYLGGLKNEADINAIISWLEHLDSVDAMVVSMDTIAYGGLIPSRRSKDSVAEIKERLDKFKEILKGKCKKVYAFSSIMRISNNNVNEEEKEYWSEYGTQIFEYSYNFHKSSDDKTEIPKEIINDYLATRYRNFQINKIYLEWLSEGVFETLVYSKDDCAEFGLNVLEAEILEKHINERNLPALVKTGADEIPLSLFSRAVCKDSSGDKPKFYIDFLAPDSKHLISNYEDISIEKSVISQVQLAGVSVTPEENDADIILVVNNFKLHQGEIVMGVTTKSYSDKLILPEKPFMIADVRFANGADNKFVDQLLRRFERGVNYKAFYGYSAWNTSANTLGSLICAGLVKFLSSNYDEEAFRKLQTIRFLDDWAYQANIRQVLKGKGPAIPRPDFRKLSKFMIPYERKIKKIFGIKQKIQYKFPWKRFFEIEIVIK